MKRVLSLFILSFIGFAWAQEVPFDPKNRVLDIEAMNQASQYGVESVRSYLKSSGDAWENVYRCNLELVGRTGLRMSDLAHLPVGSVKFIDGQIVVSQQAQRLCRLPVELVSISALQNLIRARLQVGAELFEALYIPLKKTYRRTFDRMIQCQLSTQDQRYMDTACYERMFQELRFDANQKQVAQSLLKEAALLTLLIDRNPNPEIKRCGAIHFKSLMLEAGDKAAEFWDLATMVSPYYDRNLTSDTSSFFGLCY